MPSMARHYRAHDPPSSAAAEHGSAYRARDPPSSAVEPSHARLLLIRSPDARQCRVAARVPTWVMTNASHRAGGRTRLLRGVHCRAWLGTTGRAIRPHRRLPSMARHYRICGVCGVHCRAWLGTTGFAVSVGCIAEHGSALPDLRCLWGALPSMARHYRILRCLWGALPSMARHYRICGVCGVHCRAWLGTTGFAVSVGCIAEHGSALPDLRCLWGALPSMARHYRICGVCGVHCRAWLGTTGFAVSVGCIAEHGSALPDLRCLWGALPSMARHYRILRCLWGALPSMARHYRGARLHW